VNKNKSDTTTVCTIYFYKV